MVLNSSSIMLRNGLRSLAGGAGCHKGYMRGMCNRNYTSVMRSRVGSVPLTVRVNSARLVTSIRHESGSAGASSFATGSESGGAGESSTSGGGGAEEKTGTTTTSTSRDSTIKSDVADGAAAAAAATAAAASATSLKATGSNIGGATSRSKSKKASQSTGSSATAASKPAADSKPATSTFATGKDTKEPTGTKAAKEPAGTKESATAATGAGVKDADKAAAGQAPSLDPTSLNTDDILSTHPAGAGGSGSAPPDDSDDYLTTIFEKMEPYMDTYEVYQHLIQAGFTPKQSDEVIHYLISQINSKVSKLSTKYSQMYELENERYLFESAQQELRVDITRSREQHINELINLINILERDFNIISDELNNEFLQMKNDTQVTVNDQKSENTLHSKKTNLRIQETNHKITTELNSAMRSEIESLRWHISRWGIMAILVSVFAGCATFYIYKIKVARRMSEKNGFVPLVIYEPSEFDEDDYHTDLDKTLIS